MTSEYAAFRHQVVAKHGVEIDVLAYLDTEYTSNPGLFDFWLKPIG